MVCLVWYKVDFCIGFFINRIQVSSVIFLFNLQMLLSDQYKTIKKSSEGFFKDRGSKFYAFAFPVENSEEIANQRALLRKKFYDARHHVYAYRLGQGDNNAMASDDGEPSNSSGPPILGKIRSYELTNILIVIVRYFGGTKLGIPGLINAYRTAAEEAINNTVIIVKTLKKKLIVKYEYPLMNAVMRTIKDNKLEIEKQDFALDCKITLNIRESDYDKIYEIFNNIYGVEINKI